MPTIAEQQYQFRRGLAPAHAPVGFLWAVHLQLCLWLIRHYHPQVSNRLENTFQVARVQALKLGALTRREVR